MHKNEVGKKIIFQRTRKCELLKNVFNFKQRLCLAKV